MVDQYNRDITYIRISITDRCNLRCKYCMPKEGVSKRAHNDILTYEEITEVVGIVAELGIKKVRITGGEPLVRPGVVGLCQQISQIEGIEEVCMTTNGILLESFAKDLRSAGVSRVNISLDTLDENKYKQITRGGDLDCVLRGIQAARDAGMRIKINTVLIGEFNDDEIVQIAGLTKKDNIDSRFIELMPMQSDFDFDENAYISGDVVLDKLKGLVPVLDNNGVAKLYRMPGAIGRVGVITPLSQHFCATCNRIRLTAEGNIKPCLHSKQEINIRGLHGNSLKDTIIKAILMKPKMHGILSARQMSEAGRAMHTIGG